MSVNINLVGNKTPIDPRIVRLAKVRKASFVVLFILSIASVGLFLTNLRLSTNSLKSEQNRVAQELSVQDQKSAKIFLLNSRVREISSILEKRKTYAEMISNMVSGSSVTVVDLQIQGDLMNISVSSNSLNSLNDFLSKVLALSEEKKLSNVTMESLVIDGASYTMTVKANIL